MNSEQLIKNSKPFLDYIVNWHDNLKPRALSEIINGNPDQVAVISVDVIKGFCYEGPLASPRIAEIVEPITALFKKSYEAGIRNFVLAQDNHPEDAVEFEVYPPHCVRGTSESEAVDQFKELPFFHEFKIFPKNSISAMMETNLNQWLDDNQIETFIVVGDCTDLCTYQLAMGLKLRANARNEKQDVILPVDCVDTYDLPVSVAEEIDGIPHDGDLLHHIFLYHMMANGIEVVAKIE